MAAFAMPSTARPATPITSRNDIRVRRIRRLHLRAERDRTGLYYIEGMRFVSEAARHHVHIQTLVVCPPLLIHPFAQKLVRWLRRAGTPTIEVTPEVLQSIALVDDPQGVGAVVHQRWEALDQVRPGGELCWIALDTVQSPGNLGSILRTSEAVGGAGLIVLGDGVDPYDPATVRSSMAAIFAQRFVRTRPVALARWTARHQCPLVGTSPAAALDYHTVAYRAPTILLMGGERKGLSAELQALCDPVVRIPMVGRSDSLNLAVATSVLLYELFNQRRDRELSPADSRN
jgi:RNA methyltransferase, TrmH family